ncbi:MAG: ATP-binding cassette domain-containing protein, partial [Burkholderiales bacterium]|nr:ATP-binding cassette domain-containing protein [Burkholderiales bacterium]
MTADTPGTAQVKPGTAVSPSATPVTPPPVGAAPTHAPAAAATQSRLEAAGLRKSYGARLVVKEVHLAVNAGEVVGLLGPNGAGKTTT